eukprot:5251470-Alexandrium_andersonii.AAC.1
MTKAKRARRDRTRAPSIISDEAANGAHAPSPAEEGNKQASKQPFRARSESHPLLSASLKKNRSHPLLSAPQEK